MNKVIEEIENQIEYLGEKTFTATNLARATTNLVSAQEWYDKCLAERVEDEQLIAEYKLALEILKRRGVRS